TLPSPALLELLQRLIEQLIGLLHQVALLGFDASQYPGPGQQFQRVDGSGIGQLAADLSGRFQQLADKGLVQAQLLIAVADGIEAQGALQFAPGELFAQPLAQRALQLAEGFGQAQAGFQVAMVYRAQLSYEAALPGALFAAG